MDPSRYHLNQHRLLKKIRKNHNIWQWNTLAPRGPLMSLAPTSLVPSSRMSTTLSSVKFQTRMSRQMVLLPSPLGVIASPLTRMLLRLVYPSSHQAPFTGTPGRCVYFEVARRDHSLSIRKLLYSRPQERGSASFILAFRFLSKGAAVLR